MKLTREEIIDRLCNNNYDTYIVGGAIRDLLHGKKPHDEDIVTSATPDEITQLFKGQTVKIYGKSFNLVSVDGYDIATFRQDRYYGLSDKKVNITTSKTIQEDLSRRDLTINALAFCQQTGDIIDLFNGVNDLKNKVIKFVGNPEKRIYDDPNRIIRACRFLALIEGHFSDKTKDALIKTAHYIRDYVAPERIRLEILKALTIKKASLFFMALRSIGALQYIFPSLDCCVDFEHGPHHTENIFDHNMYCGDNISTRCKLLKLSGYLHDVGKPFACSLNPKTKDLTFKGHNKEGAIRVKEELKQLRFTNYEIDYISSIVDLHMIFVEEDMLPKTIRKTIRKLHERNITHQDLLRIRLADRKANIKKGPQKLEEVKNTFIIFENELLRDPPSSYNNLALNGNDIINITGFEQGPVIGKVLKILLEKVLDDPELNTKEKLTEIVLTEILKEGKY